MGPPIAPPNWFCLNGCRETRPAFEKKLLASNFSLRKNSKRLPWNAFVPDLIVALMIAPAERPNSALKLFVFTLNSSTASTDGV